MSSIAPAIAAELLVVLAIFVGAVVIDQSPVILAAIQNLVGG